MSKERAVPGPHQSFLSQAGNDGRATPITESKDDLLCAECGLLLNEAVQTYDGDMLCQQCFHEIEKLPGCKSKKSILDENGKPFCSPDNAVRREIMNLQVTCSFGCNYVGTTEDFYRDHVKSCPYQLKDCPNKEKGCMEKIPPGDVLKHISEDCLFRNVPCQYCHTETAQNLLEEHYKTCPKYQHKCSLCEYCTEDREQMVVHQRNCPRVKCPCGIILDKDGDGPLSLQTHLGQVHPHILEVMDMARNRDIEQLQLQLQASLASTYDGKFLWNISEFAKRKCDAIEERVTSIYSPPFYTGCNGYKMCVRAYLNGDGMGYKTHLSLFFMLMKGKFDSLLKWPFEHQVSLVLVDQTHRKHIVQSFKPLIDESAVTNNIVRTINSRSFRRPVLDMNVASGCPKFAELSVLEDQNYMKEDTLFIKCIVDTTTILHP